MKRGLAIDNLGRAPVPEWEEVARAAWPGRLPRPAAAAAGRIFLPVTALSFLLLVLAAWLRLPWLGLLLDDAANGLVDIIVIYKLDRLSRSICDFAQRQG